jgi:UDP-N-acetylglucosamine--N-acetylmuramyl-(pentapeptide) pyrophosphoryl-undecaprenol N-acetylglucosamine transferase
MKKRKILAVGGGSGGHVTPVVAVLRELNTQHSNIEIRFWCDKKFAPQAKGIMRDFDATVKVDTILAGKLRRYHHLTLLQHFTIPSVIFPNIRDFLLVIIGTIQSIMKLIVWRPDVVFTKGGYVCLPVGWAAGILRIPLVIHDSDAHPGLTNRLLARPATVIATGAPLEYYSYPSSKSVYVGTPINAAFQPIDKEEQRLLKTSLGFRADRPLVVVTGGGLGARLINDMVAYQLDKYLDITNLILISGNDQYDELRAITPVSDERFQLHGFVSKNMREMLAAADVVVARAGATTLLELAALAKPTVLVPNGRLTGGHQLKNAKVYADKNAVVIVDDERFNDPEDTSLYDAVASVILDEKQCDILSKNIHAFAKPKAAHKMAQIILKAAENNA